MDIEVESKRHPVRFLFKFLVFIGMVTLAAKFVARQKEEWSGLTESQARSKINAKFEGKLTAKVGEEQASAIADQVINALKEAGVIKPDPVVEAADAASDAVDEALDGDEEGPSG